MRNINFYICILLFFSITIQAQNNIWNGKQFAVSLTYDDGLNVHLDNVLPALDSLGFKATFYVPGGSASLKNRLNEWKALAKNGHELGNHTLFHPCTGKSKGREWVSEDYDLDNYSINKIVTEIELANTLLGTIDSKKNRTFAYTCGDKTIKDSSFVHLIQNDFIGARGVQFDYNYINHLDFFDIKTYAVNGQTADELIAIVKETKAKNALLVFLFHGVGGEHDLNISLENHNKLLSFLKENEEIALIAPLVDILEYVKKNQSN